MQTFSPPPSQLRQIDMDRVVIDPEYRRTVIEMLNSRTGDAEGSAASRRKSIKRSN